MKSHTRPRYAREETGKGSSRPGSDMCHQIRLQVSRRAGIENPLDIRPRGACDDARLEENLICRSCRDRTIYVLEGGGEKFF